MSPNGREGWDPLVLRYIIARANGEKREFAVRLDRETLALLAEPRDSYPAWAGRDVCRCANCPLDASYRWCPAAANLVDLVEFSKDWVSHEEVDALVVTEQRTYSKRVAMQDVASTIMGVLMAASECPILRRMRPLVAAHLPFASDEETTHRAVCLYLMAQHFRARRGASPNWDLRGLADFYGEVERVNEAFSRRLSAIRVGDADADVNALGILSSLGSIARAMVEDDALDRWERLFRLGA